MLEKKMLGNYDFVVDLCCPLQLQLEFFGLYFGLRDAYLIFVFHL